MSKGTKVLLVVMLVLISLGVIGGCSAIGWNNQAVRLESQFEAQQKSNEVEYDKVWKVMLIFISLLKGIQNIAHQAIRPGKPNSDII